MALPTDPTADDAAPPTAGGPTETPVGARPGRPTRRRVLQAAGTLLGGGALAAGGYVAYDWRQRFGRPAERQIPDHRVALPAGTPRMVIAYGADPALAVRAAIERVGGMMRFVAPGDVVLIKPNVGWERTVLQAANTHPDVVAELVRACRAAGASRVMVSDCPVNEARSTFERSGVLRAAGDAGAEVVLPEDSRYQTVRISERLGTWDVLEPFVAATKIINAPVAKHNPLSRVTGGMKNWIGITTQRRMSFHTDIHRSIAELAALMRPTLTVLDASRVLMRNGPQGGNLADVKDIGAVAASVDPVAVDAWACGLLGARPDRRAAS
ncbi:MAG: DUF362 domain-containing protein, partial [Deltaproteobacteria bacterium]|nr:DUF362 domain-containing protein [Deltaproteobacteria bacterium]